MRSNTKVQPTVVVPPLGGAGQVPAPSGTSARKASPPGVGLTVGVFVTAGGVLVTVTVTVLVLLRVGVDVGVTVDVTVGGTGVRVDVLVASPGVAVSVGVLVGPVMLN